MWTVEVDKKGLDALLRAAEDAGFSLRLLNGASPDRVTAWREHQRYRHQVARMCRIGHDPDLCRGRGH